MSSLSWYSCGLLFLLCLVDVSVLSNLVLLTFISSKASSRPQGKYMHHIHVHDDLLLLYILFARRNHEHGGTFPIFTSFALMHIGKIHVTHCLLYHAYAFTCSYIPYSHDCIHVGGAYACYMSSQSFTCFSFISLSKALMYVVINYQKGGD